MNTFLLTPDSVDAVLSRFNRFNDGLIRSIDVKFKTNRDDSVAIVTVSTKDTSADDDWFNVILRIQGLREVNFSEGRTSYIVLSDGLVVGWFEGLIFLDFGPYSTAPKGVEDFRKSGCYFAGKSATWQVEPYAE